MKDEIWQLKGTFLKLPPRELLKDALETDKKNYETAESEFKEDIQLLDNSIALYIESIQGGYGSYKKWKDKINIQAAICMANSTLNLLLLARHSVLLGYHSEALHLLRACHERVTRCYLFFKDESVAERFLSGGKIGQGEVRYKLAKILGDEKSDKATIWQLLKDSYSRQSKIVHPNLEAFKYRVGDSPDKELRERVVTDPIYGGIMSAFLGKAAIMHVLLITLFALSVIRFVFVETTGCWEREAKKIYEKYKEYVESIKKEMDMENGDGKGKTS